jgi:zinc protease
MIRERESRMKENGFWLGYLQNHFMLSERMLTLEEYKSLIASVRPQDIKAVADRYLNTKRYVQVALTPAAGVEKK